MSIEPGQTLSHYRLLEKIGEGGMGVVWKARDTVLNRAVAIKFLPADVSRDEERRRMFLQEAQLAAQVGGAHIVQVHEFGREADLDYIVMEYVEGKPLNQVMKGKALPPNKVVEIGLQVARALSRAHHKGLLHRDLKPGNVLVTPEGDAKVVDFGLAALFRGSDEHDPTRTAAPGTARGASTPSSETLAGTLAYMSPEQVRCEQLDSRSDIFSLGAVLFEMTTGRRAFPALGSADLVREVMKAEVPPPHTLVPKLPLELDRIIRKALAGRRSERYQTMDDLAVDLKRLGRELEAGSSPSYDDLKSIVAEAMEPNTLLVVPLDVSGQTEDPEFVGQSFAEAIAINLAMAPELKILPVPVRSEIEGRGVQALSRAAKEFGAGRLIHGSLFRSERNAQVSIHLVDVAGNRIEWGTQKAIPDGDLMILAASVAGELSELLGLAKRPVYEHIRLLTGGAAMAAFPGTTEALVALRRVDLDRAVEATRRLTEAFPDDPAAHALFSYALYEMWRPDPSADNRQAIDGATRRLLEVDPQTPYTDLVNAMLLFEGDGRPRAALRLLSELLDRDDLSPTCKAWVLRNRAQPLFEIGSLDAALDDLKLAISLDPVHPWNLHSSSVLLRWSGRFEEALTDARRGVALEPWDYRHHLAVGYALIGLGRADDALEPIMTACKENRSQEAHGLLAVALQAAGKTEEAGAAAERAAGLTDHFDGALNLARYRLLTGDREATLQLLKRSIELGLANPTFARDFSQMSGDPEFDAVVAEVERRVREK